MEEEEPITVSLTGGLYTHILYYMLFFIGIFFTFFIILSEANRLVWASDSVTYSLNYVDITDVIPAKIQSIAYPANYKFLKVFTEQTYKQSKNITTTLSDDEEVWYLLGIPSIDETCFLISPLAKELQEYVNFMNSMN